MTTSKNIQNNNLQLSHIFTRDFFFIIINFPNPQYGKILKIQYYTNVMFQKLRMEWMLKTDVQYFTK